MRDGKKILINFENIYLLKKYLLNRIYYDTCMCFHAMPHGIEQLLPAFF